MGRKTKKRGDTCIRIADALCFTAETNTTSWKHETPIKINLKKKDGEEQTEVEIGVTQLQTKDYGEPPEAKRAREDSPLLLLEAACSPANILSSDFRSPELWENKSSLFKATQFVVTCYSNHRKLTLHLSKISFLHEVLLWCNFQGQEIQTSILMD